jgi:hypothetical protein
MKKFILASCAALVGFAMVPVAYANATKTTPRYESRAEADNARAACILPWYRFVGACDEAIDDYPYGNHDHDWNHRRDRHGHWR